MDALNAAVTGYGDYKFRRQTNFTNDQLRRNGKITQDGQKKELSGK